MGGGTAHNVSRCFRGVIPYSSVPDTAKASWESAAIWEHLSRSPYPPKQDANTPSGATSISTMSSGLPGSRVLAVQAIVEPAERGHLPGDGAALFLVAWCSPFLLRAASPCGCIQVRPKKVLAADEQGLPFSLPWYS